ncbi:MAG: D-arabinitol 4-dehydrogenase [Rhodoferax sp.]
MNMRQDILEHGIQLHLGLGAFHRAHQVAYLQALHDTGDTRWHIVGANLRPDLAELESALIAQNGAYTLETVAPDGVRRYQRMTALGQVLAFAPDLHALALQACDPRTHIISFTVTEAGYYLGPGDRLELQAADVLRDLAVLRGQQAPQPSGWTLYGALARLLRARMGSGAGAVTLLNCDNLRHNGSRFRALFLQFLDALGDAELRAWVLAHTRCPNAMVDRITPRATAAVADRVHAATGLWDPAALMAEDFTQWVIEDDFAAPRPAWERVGVEMVACVDPYEEAKIRLLNATHSCVAWAGTLAGYHYIHEGVQDARIRAMAHAYATQAAIPALLGSAGHYPLDLGRYRDVVLQRFANPALCDTNQRVAMDGFSKIPGFILPTLAERLRSGSSAVAVAMLPALFLACLERWHRGELPYAYQDQVMDGAQAHAVCASADPVGAFAALEVLWGEWAGHAALLGALREARERVHTWEQELQTWKQKA